MTESITKQDCDDAAYALWLASHRCIRRAQQEENGGDAKAAVECRRKAAAYQRVAKVLDAKAK